MNSFIIDSPQSQDLRMDQIVEGDWMFICVMSFRLEN